MQVTDGRHVRASSTKVSTLTDQVYIAIRNDILSWKYSPNAILVEGKLAKQYKVSKTPIREARALLSQEGWIEVLPHVGYRLKPIRVSDVEEIFEMRVMAEKEAIRLAALRADDEQFEKLLEEVLNSPIGPPNAVSDPEHFISERDPLHLGLATLAGNERLKRLIYQLLRDWTRMCLSTREVREKAFAGEKGNCQKICEALLKRDVESAQALLVSHIMYSKNLILSQMTLGTR